MMAGNAWQSRSSSQQLEYMGEGGCSYHVGIAIKYESGTDGGSHHKVLSYCPISTCSVPQPPKHTTSWKSKHKPMGTRLRPRQGQMNVVPRVYGMMHS